MKRKMLALLCVVVMTSMLFAAGVAETSKGSFPEKTISLICPFAPGGGTDALARKLAEIVENSQGQRSLSRTRPRIRSGRHGSRGHGETRRLHGDDDHC